MQGDKIAVLSSGLVFEEVRLMARDRKSFDWAERFRFPRHGELAFSFEMKIRSWSFQLKESFE